MGIWWVRLPGGLWSVECGREVSQRVSLIASSMSYRENFCLWPTHRFPVHSQTNMFVDRRLTDWMNGRMDKNVDEWMDRLMDKSIDG